LVTVDCTDCKTTKQGKCAKAFWSHKFRSSGLRYELAVCIKTGEIVWLHGPFPAGDRPDVNIFRHALKHYLGENERVEADDGYVGDDPKIVKTPRGIRFMESKEFHSARAEARAMKHVTTSSSNFMSFHMCFIMILKSMVCVFVLVLFSHNFPLSSEENNSFQLQMFM
jgi:hypothetical protein